MAELSALNKLNADWAYRWKSGRERANAWLETNFDRLGRESTVDIPEDYL